MPRIGRPRTNLEPMRELNLRTTWERADRLDLACTEDGVARREVLEKLIDDYLKRRELRLEKPQKGGADGPSA